MTTEHYNRLYHYNHIIIMLHKDERLSNRTQFIIVGHGTTNFLHLYTIILVFSGLQTERSSTFIN